MDVTDTAIWQRIQQKDVKTFERYFKQHYKRFILMSCRYTKDYSVAQEIVNDVFLKIWEDGSNITIESSLTSYIYKAIINRSINAVHKRRRELDRHADLSLYKDEGYELTQIEENELKVMLYAAIDQLPVQCKKVFEMSRFEELKQQDIADKLGISIKTVKNHITIALKQISKSVENYFVMFLILIRYFLPF